jgi:hypothetical protein
VDLDTIGPDPSTGRDNEIYGKSTEIELEILKALCPKGVTPEVGDELMEAAVDVCSLPGKLATSEIAQWDQMGATLSDLSSQLQRRRNAHPRDTQWRTNNKNALGRIRTLEDLLRGAKDEVGTQRRKVYSNMRSRMLDTLYHAGWEIHEALLYYQIGLLPNVVGLTMEHYYDRTVGTTHPETWDTMGSVHANHHAKKLRIIRYNASSRAQMILQNYIYLRDTREKDFSSNSLTGAITTALQEQIHDLEASMEAPPKQISNPQWARAHCHSDFHDGGHLSTQSLRHPTPSEYDGATVPYINPADRCQSYRFGMVEAIPPIRCLSSLQSPEFRNSDPYLGRRQWHWYGHEDVDGGMEPTGVAFFFQLEGAQDSPGHPAICAAGQSFPSHRVHFLLLYR